MCSCSTALDSRKVSSAAPAVARGTLGASSCASTGHTNRQPSPPPDGGRHRYHVLLQHSFGLTHGVVSCTGSCSGRSRGAVVRQHRPTDSTAKSSPGWGEASPPCAAAAQFGLTHGVVGCTGSCGTLSGRRRAAAAAHSRGAAVHGHRPPASTDKSSLPDGGRHRHPVPAAAAQWGSRPGSSAAGAAAAHSRRQLRHVFGAPPGNSTAGHPTGLCRWLLRQLRHALGAPPRNSTAGHPT